MEEIFVTYVLSLAVGDVQQEIVAGRLHFLYFLKSFFNLFFNYPLSFHKGMTGFSKLKKEVKVQRKTLSVSITLFQKFK